MDVETLRDHAKDMLDVIARDLETSQTAHEQSTKSQGKGDAEQRAERTPAQKHGAGRAESGLNVGQMVSEFRALRASVVRLWTDEMGEATRTDLEDLIRFNEAIDQAIAESITRYTGDIALSKERFLAILGHDLRTPLGAIVTSSKFMLDTGELQEPNLTLVTRIAASATRMNQMVLDLLDFTRTRLGDTIPIVRADTDLRRVINDVVAEISTMYPKSTVHVETTGNLRGAWDSDRLAQALTNLFGNAVQHGSPRAPIRVAAREADGAVILAVHNEGAPIPQEQIGNLFRAMKRSREDGARDRRHLGLGLYIVEKIIHAHGGSIDVSSSMAEGTTFALRLPRSERALISDPHSRSATE